MTKGKEGWCYGPCKQGVWVRCEHYAKWLTDYTTRTRCYCEGKKFTELSKWR